MMSLLSENLPESPLLQRLEEQFSIDTLGAMMPSGGVPRAMWEAALLGPARDFLSRPGRHFRGQLVELTWELCGAVGSPAAEFAQLVEVMHAGSLIIDDVQDGSPYRRGKEALHRLYGVPIAINTGNWLYFWPHELLSHLHLPPVAELELRRQMARAQLLAHQGQALDLSINAGQVVQHEMMPVARCIARLKTGSLTEFAARTGAIAAGAPPEEIAAVADFGRELGIALQQLDDLGGILSPRLREKGLEDLRHARVTFAWGYAAERMTPTEYLNLTQAIRELREPAIDSLEAISESLSALVSDGAREQVRTNLQAALRSLHERFGPNAAVLRISREIERLERGYE
jgi:geranylgeranyl pyrophosphate synthase